MLSTENYKKLPCRPIDAALQGIAGQPDSGRSHQAAWGRYRESDYHRRQPARNWSLVHRN